MKMTVQPDMKALNLIYHTAPYHSAPLTMNTPHFHNREFPIPRGVEEAARELYAVANAYCANTDASMYRALQGYDRLMDMEGAVDPQFIAQVRRSRISCYLSLKLIDEIERDLDYVFANPVVPIITTTTSTMSPPAQKWRSRLRFWRP
ncbi:hypothetical protein D9615_007110 [Tricholomella constricta]|uniref:Uncharacterized protein n=1 Tax=Tricholomella constricta TaxID=117010 RepID=A0A8H5H7R4_9AGAR|nr:hypothetical protein D9615_007110 [Tricholomella constricta]